MKTMVHTRTIARSILLATGAVGAAALLTGRRHRTGRYLRRNDRADLPPAGPDPVRIPVGRALAGAIRRRHEPLGHGLHDPEELRDPGSGCGARLVSRGRRALRE